MSGVNADDARVNAAGYHKLMGIENIDLSVSTAAQSLTIKADDIDQLSETNALRVVLGSGDTVATTNLGSVAWGYFTYGTDTAGDAVAYDRHWSGTASNTHAVDLYATGGTYATGAAANVTGSQINSAPGSETLTGTSAADVFYWAQNQSGSDTVTGFHKTTDGDKLDLRGLLTGTGAMLANIGNFVQITQSGTNAVLKVDTEGSANFVAPAQTITLTDAWADLTSGVANNATLLTTLYNQHVVLLT
jgi:hypothetical protein